MRTLVFFALIALSTPLALGQEAVDSTSAQQPTINFQVLNTRKIDLGNRTIIFNRVAPPVLPEPPPPPLAPTPEETAAAEAAAAAEALANPPKKQEFLFLSTTVYDRQVTEVRWFDHQQEYKIFSNIDFNYMAGLGWFETADTEYMLILGIGNETSEQVSAFNEYARQQGWPKEFWKEIPPVGTFSTARSEYAVVEDSRHPSPTSENLATLDALHVYFDANKQRLAEEYVQREAARIAREQWLKEHPPVPKDTIINFWLEEPSNPRNRSKMEAGK